MPECLGLCPQCGANLNEDPGARPRGRAGPALGEAVRAGRRRVRGGADARGRTASRTGCGWSAAKWRTWPRYGAQPRPGQGRFVVPLERAKEATLIANTDHAMGARRPADRRGTRACPRDSRCRSPSASADFAPFPSAIAVPGRSTITHTHQPHHHHTVTARTRQLPTVHAHTSTPRARLQPARPHGPRARRTGTTTDRWPAGDDRSSHRRRSSASGPTTAPQRSHTALPPPSPGRRPRCAVRPTAQIGDQPRASR